jgi:hypothetical protein
MFLKYTACGETQPASGKEQRSNLPWSAGFSPLQYAKYFGP